MATLRASRSVLRIQLRQRVYMPGPGEGCTNELEISRLVVPLYAAVDGRHVEQPGMPPLRRGTTRTLVSYLSRWVPDPPYPEEAIPLVPRVTGLFPADAIRVLRQQGFHVVIHGHGTNVIAQSPSRGHLAPGTTAAHPFAGVVALRTSR